MRRVLARAISDPHESSAMPAHIPALIAAAHEHRVLLLLGWRLRAAGAFKRWPASFVDAFEREERDAVAMDCIRQKELANVLCELEAAGARQLLFKGAALAHTHYPAPHVRVRADTDLLVAASEMPLIEQVLGRLGYVRPVEASGHLVSYQSHYHRTDSWGVTHAFDVHWKISNFQSLADRFSHDELWESRLPVPALGPSAFTVDPVSALLLALLHRAGHHPGSKNLLWIHDLHVLARELTHNQRQQFQELADDRGLVQIAIDGLAAAHNLFGGASEGALAAALRATPPRRDDVPARREPWTQTSVLYLDLKALSDWRQRGRLLREHVLPPPSYMKARYGVRSNALLPALYFWRVVRGMPKWLVPRSPGG